MSLTAWQLATVFASWEKVVGPFVRANRAAFSAGLSKQVMMRDLVGAACLDRVYSLNGRLDAAHVAKACRDSM